MEHCTKCSAGPLGESAHLCEDVLRKRITELEAENAQLRDSLVANVIARRNQDHGCCDWSCHLCAPVADAVQMEEG